MTVRLFVPRWMDAMETNAQNSNARAILSRASDVRARWTALCLKQPCESIRRSGIDTLRTGTSRFWQWQLAFAYQSSFDAVFYPGPHWGDKLGLQMRKMTGRKTPVIATLEGLIASSDSLQRLAVIFGHAVYAQPKTDDKVPRIRWLYESADHIIAISPFLARAGQALYGEKVSCVPLGIDRRIFHAEARNEPARCRVVGCGTAKRSKNPQAFLGLAARYKEADFVWFGGGPMLTELQQGTWKQRLNNLVFAGPIQPEKLADEFRRSSVFVLPSHAEGVPKVTQEAAACGLPIILNGFFEAPTVTHGQNGLVAWSDDELSEHVGTLIRDPETRHVMGKRGAAMARNWDWDKVAPVWEDKVIQLVSA